MSRLRAWWQLLRVGNVFTAISNVLAGFLLVQREWQPLAPLLALVGASAAFYLSGMVLNDVFDTERDRQLRPERPIPAGRIARQQAAVAGWSLMLLALVLALIAAQAMEVRTPATVAVVLAAAIVSYDAMLKNTALGSLAMGACRFFNVLLGGSIVPSLAAETPLLIYAAALGLYTMGITLVARREATHSTRAALAVGYLVAAVGVATVGVLAALRSDAFAGPIWWFAYLCLWLWVGRAATVALQLPTPTNVQNSVKQMLLAFIPLDALIAWLAVDWPAACVVLALLAPILIATRRIAMT